MPTGPIPPDQVLDSALAAFLAAMHTYLPMLLIWGIALLSAAAFCGLGYALLHCITTHDWFGTIMNMAWAFARVMVIFMVYDNFQAIGSIFPTMGKIVGWQIAGLSPTWTYFSGRNAQTNHRPCTRSTTPSNSKS